jgi:hypothetical protein
MEEMEITKAEARKTEENLITEIILKKRLVSSKNRAAKKGWDFDLDYPFLQYLYTKQKGRCPYTTAKLTHTQSKIARCGGLETLSIDRIDSQIGYIKGNVELVSSIVNNMKNDMSKEQFKYIISLIAVNLT